MAATTADPVLAEHLGSLKTLTESASGRTLTSDEERKAQGLIGRIEGRKADLDAQQRTDDLRSQIDNLAKDGTGSPAPAKGDGGGSLGERYTNSDAYGALAKQYPDGMPQGAKGIHLPSFSAGGVKTLFTTGASGNMIRPDYQGLTPINYLPLTIRDLITVASTSSDTVEFAQVQTRTSAAATVAEATSTTGTGTAGGVKPESAISFTQQTTAVQILAHWMPVTKKALADVGQLRSLIDTFLMDGLGRALEDQIINGDGVGTNFTGILNATGTTGVPYSNSIFETVRKGLTALNSGGYAVSAILMSPADAEKIDLEQDGQNRYYGNGPFGLGPNTLWGIPRITSDTIPEGTALMGDLREAMLFDREAATLTTTDSHDDFFVRNLVAILAEMRAAFAIRTPAAIGIVDLTP